MKKIVSLLMIVVFLFAVFIPVFAANEVREQTEYLDDGSYIITQFGTGTDNEKEPDFFKLLEIFKNLINIILGRNTVTKTKNVRYYDSNGVLLWEVFLKAKFTYSKSGAVCDSAQLTYTIYDSDWKMISSRASKSQNTAKGEFTVRQVKLGVQLKTVERTVTMTCDSSGNIK